MLFRLLTFFLICFTVSPAAAQDAPSSLASRDHPPHVATDFNLITAVDVSASISQHEEWLQYRGLALGVLDPGFLARIAQGAEQRIGFVVFTWSSGGQVDVVVPWTVIATRADAERVAAQLNAAPRIDRSGFGRYGPASSAPTRPGGGMTDIGEAVQSATALGLGAPFAARRSVVNILSNGVHNDGAPPDAVRDQAIALGMTINGIVFGPRIDLPDYFRSHVIGGPGAFLMTVTQPSDLPQALQKKFWQDLIAALAEPAPG